MFLFSQEDCQLHIELLRKYIYRELIDHINPDLKMNCNQDSPLQFEEHLLSSQHALCQWHIELHQMDILQRLIDHINLA